jgi:septal ring factor EnvC (AmiA/AmiB activator)
MNAITFCARAVLIGCISSILAGLAAAPAAIAEDRREQPQAKAVKNNNRAGPKRREGKEGSEEAKLDAAQARELYIRRKRRLEQIQAQQQELTKDKQMLATNRARMQARLIDTARSLRLSEKRLTEIEEQLAKARLSVKERREKLDDKAAQMSALFALMQGMSRQPPPVMITHSRDALNMIRSGMVLATFYEDVEKLARQISHEVDELEKVQKQAEKQERLRKAEQAQATRLKSQIDLLLIENQEQLEATVANLEGLRSVTKIHAASLKSLEEVLPALDEEVGKKSQLGAYENELKQGTAELRPDVSNVALLQPGRMKPSIPFTKAQGLLPLPVQGKMLIRFAQNGDDGAPSKGVHIETRAGAQVVSPCDGWILYAGPFRSYGQLLIINPGGGYHVVIAGMDHVQATVGQFVLAGEPIAVMGSVEARNGEKAPVRPTLYVEFRRDQQPIDPAPWWSAGIGKG